MSFHWIRPLIATASVLLASIASPAMAAWPERPVKIIVPYAPGGSADLVARPWADALTKAYGQAFVIDNRGGASGTIGTEAAARSPADGYTFLMAPNSALTQVPQLRKVNYNPNKDLVPVGRVGDIVCGFTIVPSLPVKTLPELVEYARKNPGKLAYGSPGIGTSNQMRLEMLKYRTGVDILHVPYPGSADALNDLLAGRVQIMNEINVIPHIKAGKLRLLAINHANRHPDFPDVPTLTEAGYPDSDVPIFFALYAPAGVPADIVEKLNARMLEIGGSADMMAKMREINVVIPLQKPAEIAAVIAADYASVGKLIKDANIKLE